MELEKIAQVLIFIHASFGGVALVFGLISILSKKGRKIHKLSGKIFFYTMLFSAISALIISVIPNHESVFLFTVGIFSSYFILSGYRAIKHKFPKPNLTLDKIISFTMLITGIIMILYPLILNIRFNIVLTVFGIVGITFSIIDFFSYRNLEKLKENWLKTHLGKMMGGYISATTAFVVVNNVFPSFYGWFIPGIIGGIIITFWTRKIKDPSK